MQITSGDVTAVLIGRNTLVHTCVFQVHLSNDENTPAPFLDDLEVFGVLDRLVVSVPRDLEGGGWVRVWWVGGWVGG